VELDRCIESWRVQYIGVGVKNRTLTLIEREDDTRS
jgi:hypothetical protein